MMKIDFQALTRAATGDETFEPYAYQEVLAADGLPDLLCVPTGAGKTMGAILPWLYRRREHPDQGVREATPRWLVVVLPQRALVEQTVEVVRGWIENLGLERDVPVHVLMGGVSRDDDSWKMHPAQDAIFIGTQDMILSRLLMRGYAEPRPAWPVAFGLLHAGAQFVFDEVQLMGPALPTSLQLEGLRTRLGTAMPSRSMWMSATVDRHTLCTPDYPGPTKVVELTDADRAGPLRRRLEATRVVRRAATDLDPKRYPVTLAVEIVKHHMAGTRTIAVLNTVDRATQVYDALTRLAPAARVVLLHSRFRPGERAAQTETALAKPTGAGVIVVATQVLEAGVDITSRVLVTEVAPWTSIIQRAGRCNREGEAAHATLLWTPAPRARGSHLPYDEGELAEAQDALERLEGHAVTSGRLERVGIKPPQPLYPVLRERDLRDLFDTNADLTGTDIDVSRWIRDDDGRTAAVAWRDFVHGVPMPAGQVDRDELCQVPLGELRDQVGVKDRAVSIYDQVGGRWEKARKDDVRPGATFVVSAADGGYLADRGWAPSSRQPVLPVPPPESKPNDDLCCDPTSIGSGRWVTLAEHLEDVRREVAAVLASFTGLELSERLIDAAVLAGLYHDLGKAHPCFDAMLATTTNDGATPPGGPWAKSGGTKRGTHHRSYFRHELAGALALLEPGAGLLDDVAERDLVAYLVAAHHGKVRLTVRAGRDEPAGFVRGVTTEVLPGFVFLDRREVPPIAISVDRLQTGRDEGDSWQAMTIALRDRADLGPFRLGFLEAAVRVADWIASASYGDEGDRA